MLVAGRISLIRAVFYIVFQCLGAIAGTAAVKVSLGRRVSSDYIKLTSLLPF